ncbi:MAG: lipid biosynthesis B12-binding/radical SAM protein [Limisphaerales bacterium]
MPSRVLLISANRCTTPDAVFPLGLAHLNAALRKAGHASLWLDSLAGAARLEETLENFRPDIVGVSLRNVDDVLIRQRETFFNDAVTLGERIRQKTHSPLIAGGSGFSIFPRQLLELIGADFGVFGEGEESFISLIATIERGGDVSGIPGLVFRQNGKVVINTRSPSPFAGEVNEEDRPAAAAAFYLQANGTLNLQTQRGCRFRCCYCTYPLIEGKRHRCRPPETVAAELEQLQRLGARHVFVVDSIFNSTPHHVTEVCEAILRRNVKMSWGCFLRPQGLTPGLMNLMARAGLTHVEFGSDSLCNEVLQAYQKDFTFDEILYSSELARCENVEACHFLICGGPGETEATLEESLQNSRRLNGTVIMAVVGMRIYPGTRLFERAVAEGQIRRDADLLQPTYYLAPGLTEPAVFAQLQEFARRSPNWIVGDPSPEYQNLVARLRRRGVVGPLWGYFALLQRIRPQTVLLPQP